jgi:hypothetical protein
MQFRPINTKFNLEMKHANRWVNKIIPVPYQLV